MSILTEFMILNGMEFVDYYEDYRNLCQVSREVNKVVKQSNVYSANMVFRERDFNQVFWTLQYHLSKVKKFACLNVFVDTKYFFNVRLTGLRLFIESFNCDNINIKSITSGLDASIHEEMLSIILQIKVYHSLHKIFRTLNEKTGIYIRNAMKYMNWNDNVSNNIKCYQNFFGNMTCYCVSNYISCIRCEQHRGDEYLS